MKGWGLGTALIFGGVILVITLAAFGVSSLTVKIIGVVVAVAGFAIQLHSVFSMKRNFEREMKEKQLAHETLMREAAKLSPEEALAKAMKEIRKH